MNNKNSEPLRQYLKSCLQTSVYGLHFSESGMQLLGQRFDVSRYELEKTIEEVRQEAATKS